jgi:ABC-type tungstate transport system permease subunit
MTIGVLLFIAEGIASTRNTGLLDFFSPIMEHTKKVKVSYIYAT